MHIYDTFFRVASRFIDSNVQIEKYGFITACVFRLRAIENLQEQMRHLYFEYTSSLSKVGSEVGVPCGDSSLIIIRRANSHACTQALI